LPQLGRVTLPVWYMGESPHLEAGVCRDLSINLFPVSGFILIVHISSERLLLPGVLLFGLAKLTSILTNVACFA